MRVMVAVLAALGCVLPADARADGWQALDGPAISLALAGRVLGYPDGTLQDFFADGRTLYGESRGRWEVRGDQYCSVWPPSDSWACYGLERDGLDIRFTDDSGAMTTGRYVDLQ